MRLRIVLLSLAGLFMAGPAHAEWYEASSTHVVVYAQGKPDDARKLAEALERYDAALRYLLRLPPSDPRPANRLTVFNVAGQRTIQDLVGEKWVAGFYKPRAGFSAAFVPQRAGSGNRLDLNAQSILFHEYAHHMMFREMGAAYPAWFIEGFAEFCGSATIEKDGAVVVGKPPLHRAYGLLELPQLPIERLLDPGDGPMTGEELENLYGRGWLMTHYLEFDGPRAGQLTRYLKLMDAGQSSIDAARAAFGDLDALNNDLRRYLGRRLSAATISPDKLGAIPAVTVRQMTAGEGEMMDTHIVSTNGVTKERAAKMIDEARRVAAKYPGDAVVLGWLAEAELDAGNSGEALAAADRALAIDGNSRHALLWRAKALLEISGDDEAKRNDALKTLIKANRRDPDDPEPMRMLYSNFAYKDGKRNQSMVDALLYAEGVASEDLNLRYMGAVELINEDRLRDARRMLAPVAFNPHSPPSSETRALMIALDSGDRAAVDAVLHGTKEPAEDAAEPAGQ